MPTLATSISDEIQRNNAAFEAHFEQRDAAGIAGLYTRNGVLLPTGMEPIEGQAGIQAFWQGAMEMGIKRVKLHTNEVEQLTDTAIELGNYTLFGAHDQQLDQGKYVVVWKQQQGQWKLHQDIWNTSQPAPTK
ncbi:YybH family protein [Hymenobacter humi]|uniref:YybH family protein n=1 Tax=Hymenobacter humi TaxID=1411620 RepID=A0ABW2UBR1_9BACT